MMRVEVKSPDVREFRGENKRGPYVIRKQAGYLDVGKAYPVEVAIRLQEQQVAFPPGFYEIGPDCYEVDGYGEVSLQLGRLRASRPAAARAAS